MRTGLSMDCVTLARKFPASASDITVELYVNAKVTTFDVALVWASILTRASPIDKTQICDGVRISVI